MYSLKQSINLICESSNNKNVSMFNYLQYKLSNFCKIVAHFICNHFPSLLIFLNI